MRVSSSDGTVVLLFVFLLYYDIDTTLTRTQMQQDNGKNFSHCFEEKEVV